MRAGIALAAGGITLALAVSGCAADSGAQSSEDFPDDDITMVVTYAAGGPTDLGGRAVAKYMEKDLGVNVVVENVDGASGGVGTAEVAGAKPDGYTIGMTTTSAVSRVPVIEDVGYEADDLAPIGVASFGPGILYVPADSPYRTAEQLFAAAKKKPDSVTLGTPGAQTLQGVEMQRLEDEYGVGFRTVPYDGDSALTTALLGGNVDATFGGNAQVTLAQVEEGKLRMLAIGSENRVSWAEDMPTLKELGYDELTYGVSTYFLVAPDGTPEEVVDTLEGSLKGALQDPEVRKVIGEERLTDAFVGADDVSAQMKAEVEKIGPVLEDLFG